MPSVALILALAIAGGAPARDVRLLFTGDILLARNVAKEIESTRRFPWSAFGELFRAADFVAGNLEGAVGSASGCVGAGARPCFAIAEPLLDLLQSARFSAVSLANNHSHDLGDAGLAASLRALQARGIVAVGAGRSPRFVRVGNLVVGMIGISTVRDHAGASDSLPSEELRRALRLARNLSDLVVVQVHWGVELLDFPNEAQRAGAEWLVRHGADVVLGHHPHVVQPARCVLGRPVYYSLGNHLFDQKYPATKRGLVADCRVSGRVLRCGGLASVAEEGSFFPRPGATVAEAEALRDACPVTLPLPLRIGERTLRALEADGRVSLEAVRDGRVEWRTRPNSVLSVESGRLGGDEELLFALERHYSPIDHEDGVRPYVYRVGESGLQALWRGSALAWPLVDAFLLPGRTSILCAVHRGDSFIVRDPQTSARRHAAYRWNGFGFSGTERALDEQCREAAQSGR